ncbi:MAG TPA: DUF4340 domain-containing protein [Polyangiaceae bacterium]|nr:DUF4340 domain-containing protein [Polyangiaceae bacterium]
MKLGRTELMSVVLAGLAVASVLGVLATRHAPTSAERDERAKNLLPVWREDEVSRIELDTSGGALVLEKGGTGWTVRAPEPEPADAATVQKLVGALGFATPARKLEAAEANAHGLAKPRATLRIRMGESALTLALGDAAPTPSGGAYVALDGAGARRAAVVPREVVALFTARADDFRERALVTLGARELEELTIVRPTDTLRLVRGPALAFRIDGTERASRDATEPLFNALGRLSATRFLPVATAVAARGPLPPLVVTLVPRAGKAKSSSAYPAAKTVLELGGACPEAPGEVIAVVREPQARAGCVPKDLLGQLSTPRDVLRDAAPFSARKDEVEALTLERGGKRLVLERSGTAFVLREPSQAPVELDAGNQRIEAVARAPADLVAAPNPKELGLDAPSGRVTLRVIGDDDKALEEKLELGKTAPDGTLYARRMEDGAVLAFGRESARAFNVDSTLLRSLTVFDFPLSSLAELALSAPEPELVRRAGAGFELVTPRGFEADGELTTNAVLALGSLHALRWVADEDDHTFGLAPPTLTARARTGADGGTAEHSLVVGRAVPGGYFASVEGSSGVFLIERGVVERLSTLLVDRSPLMVEPSTLARLTLRSKGRELTFERRGGELRSEHVDPTASSAALAALGSLRAEAALHSGAARTTEGLASPVLEVRAEPSPGLGKPRAFKIGASDEFRGESVRTARADGIDATFVVADAKLRPLLDLF